MNKERLTAFSDGVIAIIITIMVLELKVPHGATFVICLAGIGLAFVRPWLACAAYVLLASLWLVPDRRIERTVGEE